MEDEDESRKIAGTGIDPFHSETGGTQKKRSAGRAFGGVDCAALEVEPGEVLVLSSDPITGTVKDIGSHCIHITANDLRLPGPSLWG